MNQPWLTTRDWTVSAFDLAPAKNSTASATSSDVVNSPSTVSLSITCRITGVPSRCETKGDFFANSAGSARNQCYLTIELKHAKLPAVRHQDSQAAITHGHIILG